MNLLALISEFAPGEFYLVRRHEIGLTAFIALDDTRLGPAAGGIRWRAYPTPEDGALDVLRLARVFDYAASRGITASEAAIHLAGARLEALRPRYET